jgi:ribosomal protein S18 acetylase RimI-like enzyme
MTEISLLDPYRLVMGSRRDQAQLLTFLRCTYQELFPQQKAFDHLTQTVEQYFSERSRLWWVQSRLEPHPEPVAGLWLGDAIDQVTGERYSHIFMLYVVPNHRRQGLATALLQYAQQWSQARGDRQLGLQVFPHNRPALELYRKLGFQTHAITLLQTWPS